MPNAHTHSKENGITYCAIERAYNEGKCSFLKPISCHLYPIRLVTFNNGTIGLNYHRWSVCHDALTFGKEKGIPLYRMLKAPLIRRFGDDFSRLFALLNSTLMKTNSDFTHF